MRQEIINMLGDPIPTGLIPLAQGIDRIITDVIASNEEVKKRDDQIRRLSAVIEVKERQLESAIHLRTCNLGGHFYPGCSSRSDEFFTSNCEYCECWMGASRSGGPDGVDPFGECPGNPKLRDAYELLKRECECRRSQAPDATPPHRTDSTTAEPAG